MAHLLPYLREFLTPSSLDEARVMLEKAPETTMILGGGVSLGMIPRKRLTHVVSITNLNLDYIEFHGDELRIGAATTLSSLHNTIASKKRPDLRTIQEAVSATATTPLRNRITVGGVIAGIGPWADLPVAFLTYDTSVIIDGTREVSFETIMEYGPRKSIGQRSILTEIRINIPEQSLGTFMKVGRNATDLAISSVAVCRRRNDDTIIATVGGIVPRPVRLFRKTMDEIGRSFDNGRNFEFKNLVTSLDLRRDYRAPDDYRIHLTERLLKDGLEYVLNEE